MKQSIGTGHQAIENRLAHIINHLYFTFHVNMNDNVIRISLKGSLSMCFFQNGQHTDRISDRVDTENFPSKINS